MATTSVSLLERLRQPAPERGRQEAWARFVELYRPLLLYWARRRGLTEDDAGDLVQDVFARLLERLPHFTYEPGKRFRGYLYTVLQNCCSDRLRRQGKGPAAAGSGLERAAAPDNVAEFREEQHRQYLLRRALEVMRSEFEPTTWRACWEFLANDRPAADVAAELGLTTNAVYVAKFKVLRRLRAELADLLD
jgi:RNA polymerase sigma-70 factor (ECF subfamily)